MPTPPLHDRLSPTAYAALSGLAWGLATPTALGGAWVLLGAAFAGRAITGHPVRDVLRGLLAGVWWFAFGLAWVPQALIDRGDPPVYAAALYALQALPVALPWALASWLVRRGTPAPWAWGLAWLVLTEPLASMMPIPCSPAHLLVGTAGFVWPAAVGGAPVLSAVVAGIGAGLPRPGAAVLLGVWALVGAVWIEQPEAGPSLKVAVLQPGGLATELEQDHQQEARAQTLMTLAMQAADEGAELIVAPEGAWPWPEEHPDTAVAWAGLPPSVVGGRRARLPEVNRLFAFDGRALIDVFDKQILVPALERRFAGVGHDRWSPGTGPRRLDLAGQVLGPLICYEVAHASALRQAVEAGATLLVAPSNDADLVDGRGADWHLAAARMAAISTGRPLVRATTNGRSAVLASSGRSLAELPGGPEPAFATATVHPVAPAWSGVQVAPWAGALGALLSLLLLTGRPARWWSSRRG